MAWCKTNASDFLKVVFFKSAWIFACANNSNIMKDAWSFYHHIDFANASVTDKDSFWRLGTRLLPNMLTKNSMPLSNQYTSSILFKQ